MIDIYWYKLYKNNLNWSYLIGWRGVIWTGSFNSWFTEHFFTFSVSCCSFKINQTGNDMTKAITSNPHEKKQTTTTTKENHHRVGLLSIVFLFVICQNAIKQLSLLLCDNQVKIDIWKFLGDSNTARKTQIFFLFFSWFSQTFSFGLAVSEFEPYCNYKCN